MITVNKGLLIALLRFVGQEEQIEVLADQGQGPQILLLGPDAIENGTPQKDGVLELSNQG